MAYFSVSSVRSVAQSCPTLCDPMNRSTPGLPVHHQLPEFTQTHIHQVSDAIQPSHPLSSPSPAPNPSQHQSFPKSQLFASGGQSTGVSASASFLPKKPMGLQSIKQSSLCNTVGLCWLSVLYVRVCICSSKTPNLSLPPTFPCW